MKNIRKKRFNINVVVGIMLLTIFASYLIKTTKETMALNPRNLEVGDYVEYLPSPMVDTYLVPATYSGVDDADPDEITTEDLTWRVMKIYDNGTVDLVAETQTEATVSIKGSQGYNNGVFLLNDICDKLYSNNSIGAMARSFSIEDLNLSDPENDVFAKKMVISKNTYYPLQSMNDENEILYDEDSDVPSNINDILKISSKSRTAINTDGNGTSLSSKLSEDMYITQTFYGSDYKLDNMGFGLYFKDLVRFTDQNYWLATRYANVRVRDSGNFGVWGIYYIRFYLLYGSDIYQGWGVTGEWAQVKATHKLKPVVNIPISRIDTKDTTRSGLSKNYAWRIKTDDTETETTSYTSPAFEITKKMKVGINIGNTMDAMQPYWGKIYETETAWNNPEITQELLDKIKEMGFSTVRIPISYYNHLDDDGVIDERWLARIKTVVDYAYNDGLYIIINVHHDAGMDSNRWIYCDADTYEDDLEHIKGLWQQIATYFKDYDDNLFFEFYNEILNDEHDKTSYNDMLYLHDMAQELITLIRSTGGNNASRFLIVPTYGAQLDPIHIESLLGEPFQDTIEGHLIYEVHNYRLEDERVIRSFRILQNYSRMYKVPFIIGEFGTVDGEVEQEQRIYHAALFSRFASQLDIPIIWWDNGKNYKLYSRQTLEVTQPEILEALLSYYHTSSHTVVKIPRKNPTCTTEGNIEYYYCKECDKYFLDSECTIEISKNDTILKKTNKHRYGEWEIIKEPTDTEDGLKRRVCLDNPNHVETQIIPHANIAFLSGENQIYNLSSSDNLTIEVKGELEDIIKIEIDNKKIDKDGYKTADGTAIVINKRILKDLSVGNHIINIYYKDVKLSTTVTIENDVVEEVPEKEIIEEPTKTENNKTDYSLYTKIFFGLDAILIGIIAIIKYLDIKKSRLMKH